MFDKAEHPHRRYNPLTGQWVLVSPHRTKRPWQGMHEAPQPNHRPQYDPECYLCPGNTRASGDKNPAYESTFVFTNDFAAITPNTPSNPPQSEELLWLQSVSGTCRVICFNPRHDLTLAKMTPAQVRDVVDLWADQTEELGKMYAWVQVFENRGEAMGASNPHPHGQIWAGDFLPQEIEAESIQQNQYLALHGRPLLSDYLALEQKIGERIVLENEHWVVLVPFWAIWPFETMVLPKGNYRRLPDLPTEHRDALAEIIRLLVIRYDNLFQCPFPYSMGWHGAPFTETDPTGWVLHAHFYPPLLRSASVRKFIVGYELLAEKQRDITPEQAAERLRSLPDLHYEETL